MKQYHYTETLAIHVDVFAKSKKEAEDIVSSAIALAFEKMSNLDDIHKSIKDNSFDTLSVKVTEQK
jgi:hypothetical protein